MSKHKFNKMPYTRFSKYKSENFIRSRPVCKVVKFDAGTQRKDYKFEVSLFSLVPYELLDKSIESARQVATRFLEKHIDKKNFYFQIRAYPHNIIREHKFATGAGADRMSSGMARSFGVSKELSARVKKGQKLMSVKCMSVPEQYPKTALIRAGSKLPCVCGIVIEQLKILSDKDNKSIYRRKTF